MRSHGLSQSFRGRMEGQYMILYLYVLCLDTSGAARAAIAISGAGLLGCFVDAMVPTAAGG